MTEEKDITRSRYRIVFAIFSLLLLAVVVQFASIMLDASAPVTAGRVVPPQVERGAIYDRNGRILAIQTELFTVTAWTPHIRDFQHTAEQLSRILDLSADELQERLRSASGFLIIKRTITPTETDQIRALVSQGRLPGIRLEPDAGRNYPERRLASTLLGYVGVDNVGLAGIEHSMNNHLLSPLPQSVSGNSGEVSAGNRIFLTVDVVIQSELERLARGVLAGENADSVLLLAMDARTGEYLGYVSLPDFDPNVFDQFSPEQRRNRPISVVYEPGSVFKVFSVAAFLEMGRLRSTDLFQTAGGYVSPDGRFTIRDVGNYGVVDARGIIVHSSNVGAAFASERVPADSFFHMTRLFGFGEPTGISLSGEERGLLRTPDRWSGRSRQTIAIGQEIGVTANQIMAASTVLANDGVLLRPQVVSRIVSPEGRVVREFGREPIRQVISPATARTMLDYMRASTEGMGTARRITVDGLNISAKTGTAEVFDPVTGSYSSTNFIASTLAILPTEDPRIILYAAIFHPRGDSIYGSRIAVPLIRDATEFLVTQLDIPTGRTQTARHSGRIVVSLPTLPELGETVPDYSGLPKRTLLPLLQRDDVLIDIRGSGWVVRQSPPPGTTMQRGMTIRLDLE
ncbi:MAG: PASTA domain-containing protein [Spirochaetaceae bacterium]|nr:MAG: PASTA domain-containing protein [Spirochaetaceae bacterium]